MSRRANTPRRDPGRRGPPPAGIPLKARREKVKRPSPLPAVPEREPEDLLIFRGGNRYEGVDYLQQQAEATVDTAMKWGEPPLFGVSGWIVSALPKGHGRGYARVSELEARGFRVIYTPNLSGGRPGHVTILLEDPVDEDQAQLLNEAFGRGA